MQQKKNSMTLFLFSVEVSLSLRRLPLKGMITEIVD